MQNFIVCDLETTGLDVATDQIIEIAFVKVEDDKITDTYSSLINPECQIPLKIKRLTGIADEQLMVSPTLEQVKPEIYRFMQDIPLVGHNIEFDRSFLAASLGQLSFSDYWDTLDLARIVLHHAKSHSLSKLVKYLQLAQRSQHRALDDALSTTELFLELKKRISSMKLEVLLHLLSLLRQNNSSLIHPLESIIKSKIDSFPAENYSKRIPIKEPVNKNNNSNVTTTPDLKSDPQYQIDYLLGQESPLIDLLPNYKSRQEQVKMAQAVNESLEEQKILLVEAETGTGKSIAYLLPTLLWALQYKQRAIIATNTINLQEQIWQKDIPLLKRLLELPSHVALLKGRSNYICLRRFTNLIANVANLTPGEAMLMARILVWLQDTDSGDKAELNLFGSDNENWLQLCSDSDSCMGNGCSWFNRYCFVARARRNAENAHLVIINHSLLFADIVSDIKILPQHDAIIIDEAHHIEETASQYMGKRISRTEILQWHALAKKTLKKLKELAPPQDGVLWLNNLNNAQKVSQKLVDDINNYFKHFINSISKLNKKSNSVTKIRIHSELNILDNIEAEYQNMLFQMRDFISIIKNIAELLKIWSVSNQAWEDRLQDINMIISTGTGYLAQLDFILGAADPSYVYWAEVPKASKFETWTQNCILHSTPIDISEVLYGNLFNIPKAFVLTSATITVNYKFDHFKQQCGLDRISSDVLDTIMIESPFNYEQQCLLCIAQNLPAVNDKNDKLYLEKLVETLFSLTHATEGRTLVLFTAHKLLRETYYAAKPLFDEVDMCLLGHNIDGGRTRLIEDFIQNKRSVLFGAYSFWEGVDIPGDDLINVIIVKLPFAPPDDPVLAARNEKIVAQGKNAFYGLSLPKAVIRFKQGFGRLIRSEQDKGVVIVLDKRIIEKRYGHVFLNSLPTKSHLRGEINMIREKITSWIQ